MRRTCSAPDHQTRAFDKVLAYSPQELDTGDERDIEPLLLQGRRKLARLSVDKLHSRLLLLSEPVYQWLDRQVARGTHSYSCHAWFPFSSFVCKAKCL